MKIQSLVLATVSATILLPASAAFAGTTTNRVTTGWEHGTRKVKVDNVRVEAGAFDNSSINVKLDAVTDVGGRAQSNLQYNNGHIKASGSASINNGQDPFINFSEVKTFETGNFTDISNTKVIENTTFGSDFIEYRLDGLY